MPLDVEVNVLDIFKEQLGESFTIDYSGRVLFWFDNGDVKFERQDQDDQGRSEFRGMHHPNVVCEGAGICNWCGRTL